MNLSRLTSGKIRSCGCLKEEVLHERNFRHGDSQRNKRTRLNRIWLNMNDRCNNPKNPEYGIYGGKGVRVCPEWRDFVIFKEWALLSGYENPLTIERIDSSLGYNPENCEWITLELNSKRANSKPWKVTTPSGEEFIIEFLNDYCKENNLNYEKLRKDRLTGYQCRRHYE